MSTSATQRFHDDLAARDVAAGGNLTCDIGPAACRAAFLAGQQAHHDGWGPIPPDVWCAFAEEDLRVNYRDGWHEAEEDRQQYAASWHD